MTQQARREALGGAVALVALVALAAVSLTPPWTRLDLGVDQAAAGLRFGLATAVFIALTDCAQEVVGLGALAVGLLVLERRDLRWQAARLFVMAGGAWTLALVVKHVLDRPRPPARLWALTPDPTGSFPSGHDTTATVLVLVVWTTLVGLPYLRALATALAAVFALAVGVSRVYLGDHYPSDVVGSYLTVVAAALLASAVLDLPAVRRAGARLLRIPDPAARPPAQRAP
jgi:membrane-associated phospholipid phosphatase